jgi:hypothetical protein
MKELTLERNPINARNVAKPSLVTVPFDAMKRFTVERNPTSVSNVGKPSLL